MLPSSSKPSADSPSWLKPLRSPLATPDGAALLAEKPIEAIYARADGMDTAGIGWQWVWNVASNPNGRIRNLRFWRPEIEDPKSVAKLSLEEVISAILPPARREYQAGTVCQLFQLRPITLSALRGELNGRLVKHVGVYPRTGLTAFLRRRWLGAAAPKNSTEPKSTTIRK